MIDTPVVWSEHAEESIPSVLQTWAQVRGLRLVQPREGGSRAIEVDASIAQRVEEALHAARELLTQHDADGAERALARAEALLRAHPELPQGAWLLAEVERGWAARFARLDPPDAERAARHWRAAAALDGGRAAGVGEVNAQAETPVSFSLALVDSGANASELRWDGEIVAPGSHTALPGLHQLVAKQDGAVVFAQWIAIAQGTPVRIALPMPEPCSRADLAGARMCGAWVLARRTSAPSTFLVRVCSSGGCGPELTVSPIEWTETRKPKHHGLPGWAAWTLGGAGVAAALGVAAGIIAYFALPPVQQTRWITSPPQ